MVQRAATRRGSGSSERRPLRLRDERGSGSVLVLGLMVITILWGVAAISVAGYLLASHQARAAADLAALSGAVSAQSGRDGCREAEVRAVANRGAVTSCRTVGDQIDFVITVEVRVPVTTPLPGLPGFVAAVAFAGPAR